MTYKNDPISDINARKKDHLDLALNSRVEAKFLDQRFYYEPALNSHPTTATTKFKFLDHDFDFPFWVSSMTGGTEKAQMINERLAQLCAEFNLGMGLGSIRPLLDSNERLKDFNFRSTIGNRPFYANLGVAQLEDLLKNKQINKLQDILESLQVNGIFIHLNPLQEWFQPEGDRFLRSPVSVIEEYLSLSKTNVMVKEVGHGMGPGSLAALLKLNIQGIEFGAFGGTNFSSLEQTRNQVTEMNPLTFVGHTAVEMVDFVNEIKTDKEFIISGGVNSVLDGYYLRSTLKAPSVIGFASAWLTPAQTSYESLKQYFIEISQQYKMCEAYLKIKERKSL